MLKRLSLKVNCILISLSLIIIMLMLISVLFFNRLLINIYPIILVLVTNILLIFLSIKLNRVSTKTFLVMIIFISFIVYGLWNIYARTVPRSDYKVLLDGANKIINGTFTKESFDKSNYFYFYNYQIGYTVYLALIIKFFGNSLMVLKILECLYMTLTSITLYKIMTKISTKDVAAASSIMYAIYIPNIMGSSIINNQHISTLLLCLSLYFILNQTKTSLFISGILLGFVQIFRPIAIIVIIAVFMHYTYKALKEGKCKEQIKLFIVFILAFIIVVKTVDFAVVQSGLTHNPISKGNASYFKFVLGLKGDGVYNIPTENAKKTQVYFDLQVLNFDYNKYNKQCIETIEECIKDYKITSIFVQHKMLCFMGYKDNQYSFAVPTDKMNKYVYILVRMGNIQYIILLVGAFITIIFKLRKPIGEIDIFCILIIGFILIHVFIETQTRYRYEIYLFLTILTFQFLEKITDVNKKEIVSI